MNLPEILNSLWHWWVTGGGLCEYSAELAESRGFQLVFVVGVLVWVLALIFNKKFREEFF